MLEYIEEDDTLRVKFPHQLDTLACDEFQKDLLLTVHQKNSPVVFDMSEVMFISSEFLKICCMIRNEVGEENLTVTKIHPMIYKVFRTAGLTEILQLQ